MEDFERSGATVGYGMGRMQVPPTPVATTTTGDTTTNSNNQTEVHIHGSRDPVQDAERFITGGHIENFNFVTGSGP